MIESQDKSPQQWLPFDFGKPFYYSVFYHASDFFTIFFYMAAVYMVCEAFLVCPNLIKHKYIRVVQGLVQVVFYTAFFFSCGF